MTVIAEQFRNYVIKPALAELAPVGVPHTQFAEDLLMATAAQESLLGTYLVQIVGPAVSPFMIEPETLRTIIARTTPAQDTVLGINVTPTALITNWILAAQCARLLYWQVPAPLPTVTTFANLWIYYKNYYNTRAGSATMGQFAATLKLTDLGI